MAFTGKFVTDTEIYKLSGGKPRVDRVNSDEGVHEEALQRAELTVESYLTRRYLIPQTPLTSPVHLKTIVSNFFFFELKNVSINTILEEADHVENDKNLKFLQDVGSNNKKNPKLVIGLLERDLSSNVDSRATEVDELLDPVMAGRLDAFRPSADRIPVRAGSLRQMGIGFNHFVGNRGWF